MKPPKVLRKMRMWKDCLRDVCQTEGQGSEPPQKKHIHPLGDLSVQYRGNPAKGFSDIMF